MSNEQMFTTILERMDTMETGLIAKMDKLDDKVNKLDDKVSKLDDKVNKLDDKVNKLDHKVDQLESSMNMEFWAVRTEMEFVHKSLMKEIDMVNDKVDRFWVTKDVEGHDELKVRVDVLEKGYQELKEKIV